MPRLLRDNTDPAVTADVERVAEAYGEPATPSARPSLLSAVALHGRRYRRLYAAAALLLGVLVLRDPVESPVIPQEGAVARTPSARVVSDAVPSPAIDIPLPLSGGIDVFVPGLEAFDIPSFPPATFSDTPSPAPLRIIDSGYASITGGTPLEQPPPGDGLPVGALLGQTTKLSFIRLGGTEAVLRLNLVPDPGANLNEGLAAVRACRITHPGWAPTRGAALDQAPGYDASDCVTGAAGDGGVWSFDFGSRDPADPRGFALVPATDVPVVTFQVTFSPVAAS